MISFDPLQREMFQIPKTSHLDGSLFFILFFLSFRILAIFAEHALGVTVRAINLSSFKFAFFLGMESCVDSTTSAMESSYLGH